MTAEFEGKLKLEYDVASAEKKPYVLLEPFGFFTKLTHPFPRLIIVPAGYRTDFASVPRFFWRIFPPFGKYAKAAVIHDWLCDEQPHSVRSDKAADIFDEAMQVLHVSTWKRRVMIWAVKCFGPKFQKEEPYD